MKLGKITWCPGCPNFAILEAAKKTFQEFKTKELAVVGGIGCHGKIHDYLPISGIYSLHGRVLPTCLGIKIGNPNLKVIGFAGDGDTYAEGISHFIHACRYNANLTLIVHNNQSFSLTTGQPTPTSEKSYKNRTKPIGSFGETLNPIKVALASGATFIARTYALDIEFTKQILKKAILHKGFSFVEILQPCLVFHDTRNFISKNIYKVNNKHNINKAVKLASIYNYDSKSKIPIGIFYQKRKLTLEEQWPQLANLMKKKKAWYQLKK